MNSKMFQTYFLIALVAVSCGLTFFIFRPFLVVLILAAVFAVVLQPLYRGVLRRMSGLPGLAAFLTIIISVLCILVPLTLITVEMVGDAQNLYASFTDGGGKVSLDATSKYINDTVTRYVPSLGLAGIDLSTSVNQYIKDGLTWLVQNLSGLFGGATQLFISFFIFLFALYYLLRDGMKLKRMVIEASPLLDSDDNIVFARLELAINSVIRGSLTIALIQGILTGIGFTIFGIPNSILWGAVAALAALIPALGTALVLLPGVAYLFIVGSMWPAVGLLIWSVFAVGLIDNFLGPRLVGKGMQIHPLIVLLSVFGGLVFFGASGIFLGPLCTSLLFALVSIYPHISKQAREAKIASNT